MTAELCLVTLSPTTSKNKYWSVTTAPLTTPDKIRDIAKMIHLKSICTASSSGPNNVDFSINVCILYYFNIACIRYVQDKMCMYFMLCRQLT